jgi:hypothetical protein
VLYVILSVGRAQKSIASVTDCVCSINFFAALKSDITIVLPQLKRKRVETKSYTPMIILIRGSNAFKVTVCFDVASEKNREICREICIDYPEVHPPILISLKIGMSEDLFGRSTDPTL